MQTQSNQHHYQQLKNKPNKIKQYGNQVKQETSTVNTKYQSLQPKVTQQITNKPNYPYNQTKQTIITTKHVSRVKINKTKQTKPNQKKYNNNIKQNNHASKPILNKRKRLVNQQLTAHIQHLSNQTETSI